MDGEDARSESLKVCNSPAPHIANVVGVLRRRAQRFGAALQQPHHFRLVAGGIRVFDELNVPGATCVCEEGKKKSFLTASFLKFSFSLSHRTHTSSGSSPS
jgi:hypothetical protein